MSPDAGAEREPHPSLAGFSVPVSRWFSDVFTFPTPAQVGAWEAIGRGDHTLLIAPTGSGKTLAAFLHALDRLSREPRPDGKVRVVYISPLKALAVDVERNLRAPLRGIQTTAERLGLPGPDIKVAVRSGDTPAADRRKLQTHPPDILITTPESLFLMLSSQVASTLDAVEVVIVDEVHALAGTKRGVHLMVSLERLAALRDGGRCHDDSARTEIQRIGLSATVRPPERVAEFLAGDRLVTVVAPPPQKSWQLSVEVPVPDLSDLPRPPTASDESDRAARDEPAAAGSSIWPFVEQRVLDLVDSHRTTLCFVNSRRVAERLTAHLNELHAVRLGAEPAVLSSPAQVMGQSGAATGGDGNDFEVVARAHHGSVSKERRAQIEADLKAGRLPCVVATSSLELGIDMGSVDQVIQVSSPPSVASGLQRVGRAGHQVGAVSKGVVLPTHRGDLVEAAVVVQRMLGGQIEEVATLTNPLDVLAQQVVSMCLDEPVPVEQARTLISRVAAYRTLPTSAWEGVLDMLSGRYPSEDFAELRPRLVWDRVAGTIQARPGSRRLVTTSGGTIPDRGLFGVFLAGGDGPGRRVGELDEEMVYESRVGDVFTLGTSSWRIEQITPNQVLVSPAAGAAGRLPFWKGESQSRPAELGRAMATEVARIAALEPEPARRDLAERGLDRFAADNLVDYLTEQRQATGIVPDASAIVIERFTDELGDWRVCIHSGLGQAVLAPWALAIERAARERYGIESHASASNDGIILRIPNLGGQPPGAELVALDADDIEAVVTDEVFGSALFASRFRECASRALLLPRRDPTKRSPLWQQRMRSAQLLSVASAHADFPIVLETMRECLEDVFDLPSLVTLLRGIAARRVRLVEVQTEQPSPFARSMLFGYVGEFIYDGDQPLAERKLAALSVDPALLAELLGREGTEQLLDPVATQQVTDDLQRRSEATRAGNAEQLWDIVRTIGPLSRGQCLERGGEPEWVDQLLSERRLALVRVGGAEEVAVPDDLGLLRDALGIPAPPGFAVAEPVAHGAAVARLVLRHVRTHVASTAGDIAERFGLPGAAVTEALHGLVSSDALVRLDDGWWHPQVLRLVKRRTMALLRAGVEPVEPQQYARFLPQWHELVDPPRGADSLLAAVEQLAGHPVPASALESLVLPARVAGYSPGMLDELLMAGEVVWTGHEALGLSDGWVQLWPADLVLTTPAPETVGVDDARAEHLWTRLAAGGAWQLSELTPDETVLESDITTVWRWVWAGLVTSDSFAAVRALSAKGAVRRPATARPLRRGLVRPRRPVMSPGGPPGRWRVVRPAEIGPTERHVTAATLLLGRHGVLTRGAVTTEPLFGSFSEAYRVLTALEETGAARRGYVVEGLGAAQFALPGAVDRVRDTGPSPALLLAASDPANPFGAALPWPESAGHRPSRKAGALVVIDDGRLVAFLERGVKTLVTFPDTTNQTATTALGLLASAVTAGRLREVTIERINGTEALTDRAWRPVMEAAGFAMTPQGFRARRR